MAAFSEANKRFDWQWTDAVPSYGVMRRTTGWDPLGRSKSADMAASAGQRAAAGYRNLGSDLSGRYGSAWQTTMGYAQPYAGQVRWFDQWAKGPSNLAAARPSLEAWRPQRTADAYGSANDYFGRSTNLMNSAQRYKNALGQKRDVEYGLGTMEAQFRNPSAVSTAYDGINWSKPTYSSQAMSDIDRAFVNAPDSAWSSSFARGQLATPGRAEDWVGQNRGALQAPGYLDMLQGRGEYYVKGRSEDWRPSDITNARDYEKGAIDRMRAPSQTALDRGAILAGIDRSDRDIGGALNTQRYAGTQLGVLAGPGMHEAFAGSALAGNNPWLDRIEQQGMAKINQEMARRGHFRSGGAETALGNFGGQMAGEKFRYLGDLTKSGQQLQLQRVGAGQGLATAADQSALARANAGIDASRLRLGLAGQQDEYALGREAALARAAQMASQEGQAGERLGLDAATAADRIRLERLAGATNLANLTDAGARDRLALSQKAAVDADIARRNRVAGIMDAGIAADNANTSRANARIAGSTAADAAASQRFRDQIAGARAADEEMRERLNMLRAQWKDVDEARRRGVLDQIGLDNNLDDQNYRGIMGRLQSAGMVDAGERADRQFMAGLYGDIDQQEYMRRLGALGAYGNLANLETGIAERGQNMAIGAYGAGEGNALNAEHSAALARAAGEQEYQDRFWKILDKGMQAGAMASGAPASSRGGSYQMPPWAYQTYPPAPPAHGYVPTDPDGTLGPTGMWAYNSGNYYGGR
jgi:hypothetical protein